MRLGFWRLARAPKTELCLSPARPKAAVPLFVWFLGQTSKDPDRKHPLACSVLRFGMDWRG